MLTEQKITDKIELVGNAAYRTIQIRYDNVILRDGVTISNGNYERTSITPGSLVEDVYVRTDVTSYPTEVQNIANLCWSDASHTAYENILRNG